MTEARALRELPRLAFAAPRLASGPRGDQGVMVLPGFMTSDSATAPLRYFLAGRGHRVVGWDLGVNRGDVAGLLPAVIRRVEAHVDRCAKPVALIGWSLGGVFAREVARDRADLVTQVVTLATPVVGGPRYTRSAASFGEASIRDIEARIAEREARPIGRPITAFYTRHDGIVDWRACIDHRSPNVRNIEAASSHVGIGIDPDVWSEIARVLSDGPRQDNTEAS